MTGALPMLASENPSNITQVTTTIAIYAFWLVVITFYIWITWKADYSFVNCYSVFYNFVYTSLFDLSFSIYEGSNKRSTRGSCSFPIICMLMWLLTLSGFFLGVGLNDSSNGIFSSELSSFSTLSFLWNSSSSKYP